MSENKEKKPKVPITEERLKVLLYNAIVGLEENGYTWEDLKEYIGTTRKEYKEVMEV
jgi:hypothetical protein